MESNILFLLNVSKILQHLVGNKLFNIQNKCNVANIKFNIWKILGGQNGRTKSLYSDRLTYSSSEFVFSTTKRELSNDFILALNIFSIKILLLFFFLKQLT